MSKQTKNNFSEERESIIMDLLQQNGRVTVNEISERLGISESTTRLQLQRLHDRGLLLRTHGGAVKVDYPQTQQQSSNHKNIYDGITDFEKKMSVATAASETINDGDYIAISSGSTALLLATLLHGKKHLTVVTDSVLVANELMFDRNIRVFICGGEIRHRNGACAGPTAEQFFGRLQVDKSYSSVDSINIEYGITSIDFDPRAERALCKSGRECYVLAIASKFKVKPFIERTLALEEITHIVSDDSLNKDYIDRLEALNLKVIIGKNNFP